MNDLCDLQRLLFYVETQQKAREVLGWEPETSFKQMVSNMVANDIDLLS